MRLREDRRQICSGMGTNKNRRHAIVQAGEEGLLLGVYEEMKGMITEGKRKFEACGEEIAETRRDT